MLDLCFTKAKSPPSLEQARQVMSSYSAWIISDILSDKASRFTGFGTAPTLATEFPALFKTGTANQFQHIWALGATARFTVGVWMGNFSGETVIGRTGSSIPARIAADLLKALEQSSDSLEQRDFPPLPANVREIQICSLSGMASGPACAGLTQEWLSDKIQSAVCTWHRSGSASPVYPPEYRAWLADHFRRGIPSQSGNARIRIPVSGSIFYFDSALPPEAQAIRIETAGLNPGAFVYANDVLQGSINHAGLFALPLRRGSHRIIVEDENGSAMTQIEVR